MCARLQSEVDIGIRPSCVSIRPGGPLRGRPKVCHAFAAARWCNSPKSSLSIWRDSHRFPWRLDQPTDAMRLGLLTFTTTFTWLTIVKQWVLGTHGHNNGKRRRPKLKGREYQASYHITYNPTLNTRTPKGDVTGFVLLRRPELHHVWVALHHATVSLYKAFINPFPPPSAMHLPRICFQCYRLGLLFGK